MELAIACAKGTPDDLRRLLPPGTVNHSIISDGSTIDIDDGDCDIVIRSDDRPLHVACSFANLDVIRHLLFELDADPNVRGSYGWTALHDAALMGDTAVVKILLESKRIRVDEGLRRSMRTPLHVAAENNELEVARELLAAGANKHARSRRGRTAMDMARRENLDEMVALLNGV